MYSFRWLAGAFVALAALWTGPLGAAEVAGLDDYIKVKDAAYSWKLAAKVTVPLLGTTHEIDLVSQTWQGINWNHKLVIYEPTGATRSSTMLLLNTGGAPSAGANIMGFTIAKKVGAPIAILFGIPNQPLYDGKKEDALIAETFVRYLEGQGKDGSWPLLFPMVKSVVRAFDAIESYTEKNLGNKVNAFVLTGASKRGWTTWLAAAVDPRIKGFAPMVIDLLSMKEQMDHQMVSFGAFSLMIKDYTDRKLLPIPEGDLAQKLWKMVDPISYRDRYKQPKLIVNGSNDPYWTVDALNLYWDDIPGPKWVEIVANAGHNLSPQTKEGKKGDPAIAFDAIAAFTKRIAAGKSLPTVNWTQRFADGAGFVEVIASEDIKVARVWQACSESRDFRKSRWEMTLLKGGPREFGRKVEPCEGMNTAYYVEVEFADKDGSPFRLATQIRVIDSKGSEVRPGSVASK